MRSTLRTYPCARPPAHHRAHKRLLRCGRLSTLIHRQWGVSRTLPVCLSSAPSPACWRSQTLPRREGGKTWCGGRQCGKAVRTGYCNANISAVGKGPLSGFILGLSIRFQLPHTTGGLLTVEAPRQNGARAWKLSCTERGPLSVPKKPSRRCHPLTHPRRSTYCSTGLITSGPSMMLLMYEAMSMCGDFYWSHVVFYGVRACVRRAAL